MNSDEGASGAGRFGLFGYRTTEVKGKGFSPHPLPPLRPAKRDYEGQAYPLLPLKGNEEGRFFPFWLLDEIL